METTQSVNNKMHREIVVSSCSGKLYNNKDEWNTAVHSQTQKLPIVRSCSFKAQNQAKMIYSTFKLK